MLLETLRRVGDYDPQNTHTHNAGHYHRHILHNAFQMPSVLVAFSAFMLLVGRQEGHPARKKIWGDGVGGHWLVWMEWRPARWSVCLPLLISPCTIKSRSSLLAPAHPGGPGKRAVKRLWCGGVSDTTSTNHLQTCQLNDHSTARKASVFCA